MMTWNQIYTLINQEAKLYDNVVDLEDYNSGVITDNYEQNQYEFVSHNYIVTIPKTAPNEWLQRIFDAYLQDCDTFDKVINEYNQEFNTTNDFVKVFEFISSIYLVRKMKDYKGYSCVESFLFADDINIVYDIVKQLNFNTPTNKIDYAFATMIDNSITDDTNTITIQWTVYAIPNEENVNATDARNYILQNLINNYDKLMNHVYDNDYYINFGMKLFILE